MADRIERGLWNGGHISGYLSDPESPGRLKPDPEWADKIRHNFFDAIERLGSAGAVQRELRTLGILMPERTSRFGRKRGGRPFSKQQVIGILRNPIYIGRITWGELSTDDCHEPLISKEQFDRVERLLNETTKHRSNRRIARGHVYELRGLVRCCCGSAMTPKGAHGRRGKHFYYACTRQVHHGGRQACPAPNLPAEALEQAVLARIAEIGGQEMAREKIIQAALKLIDVDAEAVERDMTTVRTRLGVIQAEIGNLLAVLKELGQGGLASVRDELARLEAEKAGLQDRLDQLAQRRAPADATTAAARKFIESWQGVNDLLAEATPAERQTILQHLVEVIELRPADDDPSQGVYALRLWPEVPSFDNSNGGKELRQNGQEANGDGPLTEGPLVRRVDEKAPQT